MRNQVISRWCVVSVAALVAVMLAGCGTRMSDKEVNAFYGLPRTEVASGVQGSGRPSPAGSEVPSADQQDGTATSATAATNAPTGFGATPGSTAPSGPSSSAVPTPRSVAGGKARSATSAPAAGSGGGSAASGAPTPGRTPTAPETSTAARCPANPSPVLIGSVGTLSGVAGQAIGGVSKVVRAWSGSINARGGLNCHEVRLFLADDGGDPNRHKALVQQMVEQNKVIAFVGNAASFTGFSSIDYINQKRIPVIGGASASYWYNQQPLFFPMSTMGDGVLKVALGGLAATAVPAGQTKVAMIACVELTICRTAEQNVSEWAKEFGLNVVYHAGGSLTQPDYTSFCLSAQSNGAQVVLIYLDGNSTHRLARSCASVGYKPRYSIPVEGLQDSYLTDPNLDGLAGGLNVLPWFVSTNPGIAEYQKAMKTYTPDLVPSPATIGGWVSAKLFEAAAAELPEPPTSDAVLQGLWSKIKSNDLGGITAPLTFAEGKPAPLVVCYWPLLVKDGKWVQPVNAQRTCR